MKIDVAYPVTLLNCFENENRSEYPSISAICYILQSDYASIILASFIFLFII